jgi:hypothetical protein
VELIEESGETLDVQMSREELAVLANALNEVIGGPEAIEEWEFQTRLGVTRDAAKALPDAVGRLLVR